jgi:hypothetical protein
MALKDQIITIDDVREIKAASQTLDAPDFDSYVQRAQNVSLRQLLGDALWYDLFININDAKYQTLIDGEAYTYSGDTVLFNGLKPYLSYTWLILFSTEGNNNHTNAGNYTIDPATAFQPDRLSQSIGSYKTEQSHERNNIIQYLNEKSSTYDLWEGKSQKNPTSQTIDFI